MAMEHAEISDNQANPTGAQKSGQAERTIAARRSTTSHMPIHHIDM